MSQPLYLLDGTLLFFRALYGMPDVFRDREGRSINGVRGYLAYVIKLLSVREVGYCVAAFDESLTTCWRNEIYPEYKANRPAADDNIRHQLDRCRQVTALLGVPVLADIRYEADDFIATLARQSRRNTVIVSRDKDLQQLLGDTTVLLDPADDSISDHVIFEDRFGFEPVLFPDYQALTGDSVDNIPGVRGIGPKSAGRLVSTFGDLESIYAAEADWSAAGIKDTSKLAGRLREERPQTFQFREILRLDHRVPLTLKAADTRLNPPERQRLFEGLETLGLLEGLGQTLGRSLEAFSD